MTDITFDTCTCGSVVMSGAQAVAELKADNERLRAVIERVYQSSNQPHIIEMTRAALEGK